MTGVPAFSPVSRAASAESAAAIVGAFDDGRQQALRIGGAKRVENMRRIGARAILAEGEIGFRRIGGALARQLEVEPILAVEGRVAARARTSGRCRAIQASCMLIWQAFTPVPVRL